MGFFGTISIGVGPARLGYGKSLGGQRRKRRQAANRRATARQRDVATRQRERERDATARQREAAYADIEEAEYRYQKYRTWVEQRLSDPWQYAPKEVLTAVGIKRRPRELALAAAPSSATAKRARLRVEIDELAPFEAHAKHRMAEDLQLLRTGLPFLLEAWKRLESFYDGSTVSCDYGCSYNPEGILRDVGDAEEALESWVAQFSRLVSVYEGTAEANAAYKVYRGASEYLDDEFRRDVNTCVEDPERCDEYCSCDPCLEHREEEGWG